MSGSAPESARFTMLTFLRHWFACHVSSALSMAASVCALVKPLAVAPSLWSTR